MTKRRIIRRRTRPAAARTAARSATPFNRQSFGLGPNELCNVLIIGGPKYCSFTIARLSRLGMRDGIAITNSADHAAWAVNNLDPSIVIASVDYERGSGGIGLMEKLQAINPGFMVILTSSAIDVAIEGKTLRDLGWSMGDRWSFVARRKTDNGDPLGIALVTAQQGVGWIDYPVRKQLDMWRTPNGNTRMEVPVAA